MGAKTSKGSDGPRLVVVFGATGAQGGSVVRALQKDSSFKVRAVTRNTASDKAQALVALGADVVQADIDDVESLKTAIQGAHGVFAVTNYWEYMNKDREIQQGKNIVDACKAENVQHLVYSGLENVEGIIGKPCPHFDSKAVVEDYIQEQGLPFTSVRYSFYMENLLGMLKPNKEEDGSFTLGLPMEGQPMDAVPVAETGECIRQIFRKPKVYMGKFIGLSADRRTIDQMADTMSRVLDGKRFQGTKMTCDEFAALGFPGAPEIGAMFAFYVSGKLVRDTQLTRKLSPNMSTFDDWVRKNKTALMEACT